MENFYYGYDECIVAGGNLRIRFGLWSQNRIGLRIGKPVKKIICRNLSGLRWRCGSYFRYRFPVFRATGSGNIQL